MFREQPMNNSTTDCAVISYQLPLSAFRIRKQLLRRSLLLLSISCFIVGVSQQRLSAVSFELKRKGTSGLSSAADFEAQAMLDNAMQAAANYWQSIFGTGGDTIKVKYKFSNVRARNEAGEAVTKKNLSSFTTKFMVDLEDDGYDAFYLDESLNDHSEFEMEQRIYADLSWNEPPTS